RTVRKRLASLEPSPENLQIYRATDPDIEKLADSIAANGLREPPVITSDNYIVSGHRRCAALARMERVWVPCRVLRFRRWPMTKDEYIALLRDFNRQRNKTVGEKVREELIDIKPGDAYERLSARRNASVLTPEFNGVEALEIEGSKKRYGISEDKADHVKYI